MSDYFVTPWTVAREIPLAMGFSRQKYWSGLPFPPPGDLSPGIEHASPANLSCIAGGFFFFFFTTETPVNLIQAVGLFYRKGNLIL